MASATAVLITATALFILSLLTVRLFHSGSKTTSLNQAFPPTPPTVPLLGNLHQIPPTKAFLQFEKLHQQYGSKTLGVLGLRLGPSAKAVVLSSTRAVRELLDDRGAVYSSRPFFPLVEYVVPRPWEDMHLVFMPYGAKWRRARKTVTEFLKDDVVDDLRTVQEAEGDQMVWEMMNLEEGKPWRGLVLRCFGAVITSSVYGIRGKEFTDSSWVGRFFHVQDEWAAMLSPGAIPPMEIFPWLAHVPDQLTPWKGWKARAEGLSQKQSVLYRDLMDVVRRKVHDGGKMPDSFAAGLLRTQEKDGYTDLELDYIGGFLMEGGADTTSSAFEVFLLAMVNYPLIQKKAQAEVDAAFGFDGPCLERMDESRIPFLKACFLEVCISYAHGLLMCIRSKANHCIPHIRSFAGVQTSQWASRTPLVKTTHTRATLSPRAQRSS
jgi:cytochrome P450